MASTDTRVKDTYSTLYATFATITGNFTLTFDSKLIVIAIGEAAIFRKPGWASGGRGIISSQQSAVSS